MELRHIRYFLAVAEELNFTRAAEKLCIAQPPLSRQIQNLEDELGAQLFIRKPHFLQLTAEGIMFKQYALQILDLVEKSTEDIADMKKGLQGTIYFASVEGHAPSILSKWIADFHEDFPDVQYNLWNGNTDDVIVRISKGLCDLAIITEPYNAENVEAFRVFQEPWAALIPADHPLAKAPGETVSFKELAPYDLIIPSRQSRLQEIRDWFAQSGVTPKIRCRIAHTISAYELTEQGLGIAIYPATVKEEALGSKICVKRLIEPEVMATYVLIWSKEHQLSRAAEEFLDYVKSIT